MFIVSFNLFPMSKLCFSTAANATVEKSTDRLSHRVRTISLSRNESKVSIIREPYVSDGTRGFQFQRSIPAPSETVKKDGSKTEDDDDDLFDSNEDDLCAEDGSGDNYHQEENEKVGSTIRITSAGPAGEASAVGTNATEPTKKAVDSCGDA